VVRLTNAPAYRELEISLVDTQVRGMFMSMYQMGGAKNRLEGRAAEKHNEDEAPWSRASTNPVE
jgi:hypothetical protein